MPNKLENLEITKVDFVDAGANPKANISIYKRAQGGQKDEEVVAKVKTSLAKSIGVGEEELQKALANMVSEALTQVVKSIDVHLLDEGTNPSIVISSNQPELIAKEDSEVVDKNKTKTEKEEEPIPDTPEETTDKEVDGEFEEEEKCRAKKSITKGENSMECNMTEAEKVILEGLMSRMDSSERMFLQKLIFRSTASGSATGDVQKNSKEPENSKNDDIEKSAEETPLKAETPAENEVNKAMDDKMTGLMKILSTVTKNLEDKVAKAEDAEFIEKAKKYEILGVDAETLAPMLKQAKTENQNIYNLAITTLDKTLAAVEKSGIFSEVGKKGYASSARAESDLQAAAAELRKNNPNMSIAKSIDKVFQERPDLRAAFDK